MSRTLASDIKIGKGDTSGQLFNLISNYEVNYLGGCRSGVAGYSKFLYLKVRELSGKRRATLFELRAMGHPYSKNYPNNTKRSGRDSYDIREPTTTKSGRARVIKTTKAPADLINSPWLVNKQTNDFHSKWQIVPTNRHADGNGYILKNNSKHAMVFSGKPYGKGRMIPRPILQKAIALVKAEHGTLKAHCEYVAASRAEQVAMKAGKRVNKVLNMPGFENTKWVDIEQKSGSKPNSFMALLRERNKKYGG